MLKKTYIKRFGVVSVAKFTAVLTAMYGLVLGIIAALGAGAKDGVARCTRPWAPSGRSGSAVGIVVLVVLAMALVGFVTGAVLAVIYNIASRATGGIEIDLDITE